MNIQNTPLQGISQFAIKTIVSLVADLSTGPHNPTVRSTYTVPANKKAILYSSSLSIDVITAPSVEGARSIKTRINQAGAGSVSMHRVVLRDSTAVNTRTNSISSTHILEAGDIVEIQTTDLSTGGSAAYVGDSFIVEFGA